MREDYILFRLPLWRGLAYELYHRNKEGNETAFKSDRSVNLDAEIRSAKESAHAH